MRRTPGWQIIGLVSMLAACTPTTPAAPASTPAPASTSSGLKQPLTGLIDMQTITWHNQDDGHPDFTPTNVEYFSGLFADTACRQYKAWYFLPRG